MEFTINEPRFMGTVTIEWYGGFNVRHYGIEKENWQGFILRTGELLINGKYVVGSTGFTVLDDGHMYYNDAGSGFYSHVKDSIPEQRKQRYGREATSAMRVKIYDWIRGIVPTLINSPEFQAEILTLKNAAVDWQIAREEERINDIKKEIVKLRGLLS